MKRYKFVYYYDSETIEIIDMINNTQLYKGSTDKIPKISELESYIISKITLDNYNDIIDEFDLHWDYTSDISTCSQCGDANYDRTGKSFGVKYEYWKGCFGEELTIGVQTDQELQDFLTKLNLSTSTLVFGASYLGGMLDEECEEDFETWQL